MEEEITQLEEKSKGGKKEAQKEVEESYQAWLDKMHTDRKENRD